MATPPTASIPGATAVLTGPVLLNKPEDTAFKQQRIPAWQPVMSPMCSISMLGTLGVIFIVLGAIIVISSDAVQYVEIRYDQLQDCAYSDRLIPKPDTPRTDFIDPLNLSNPNPQQYWGCQRVSQRFTITKTMPQPINMYYKIENMNQNHRQYARSQNVLQLAGQDVASVDASDCSPLLTANDLKTLNGSSLVSVVNADGSTSQYDAKQAMYNPCGLIAWSKFNDSFALFNELSNNSLLICETSNYQADGTPLGPVGSCNKNNIAWSSDPGVKYQAPVSHPGSVLTSSGWKVNEDSLINSTGSGYDSGYGYYLSRGWYIGEAGHKIPDPLDQDLMVWMRLALLADFRKLHRVITVDLLPGTYRFDFYQRFDVRQFGGKKSIILTTNNWLGGQNYWLGGLYIAVGCVCVVLCLAFIVKHLTTPHVLSF